MHSARVPPACAVQAADQRSGLAGAARPARKSRVLVADHDAAGRVVNELIRNHLIAHAPAGRGHDLAVLDTSAAGPADPYDTVVLPGVRTSVAPRRCETRLLIGQPAGTVIVVPGTAADRDGVHTLTAETFGRLRRAEEAARRSTVRAVILSGWNGSRPGPSEAEQMMHAWAGPDVPIILDEAARSTAENALCTAAIIGALGEVRDVLVVASWANALRLRLAFRAALRAQGLRPQVSIVWGRAHGASWRPGIVGLFRLRQHLLAGRAMLDQGLHFPGREQC